MSDGVGCSCYARCASECGCGADWSCGECKKLKLQIRELEANIVLGENTLFESEQWGRMKERIAEAEAKAAALSSLCAEAATTLIDRVRTRRIDIVALLDLAAKLIDESPNNGRV